MKSSSRSAAPAAPDFSTARTGSICNSAAAASPAGRATGAATGCGNKKPRSGNFTNSLTNPRVFRKKVGTGFANRIRAILEGRPMGHDITLTASDNFKLGGYRADPSGKPKAAVVVIQEIFGVNHHIRAVCDRIAAQGYVAIAPSIFDRVEPNFQCGYTPEEVAIARKFVANPDWAAMLRDTQAAIDAVKDVGPVGIVGFCLGGSVAYAAAAKLSGLTAAVGFYGGAIVRFADDKPKVPTQLHFGEKDPGIPLSDVEIIRGKRPELEIHVYPGAQHGFNCEERASYDQASADLARQRSREFLAKHLEG